ncbi:MAG: hypothetical protein Q9M34_04575 [Sulfurimonas sp.]|nr:hypothetical protein [Sulfurimonas sp.]
MKNKVLVLILLVSISVYASDRNKYHYDGYKNSKKHCNTYGGYEMDAYSAGGNAHHKKKKHHYEQEYKYDKYRYKSKHRKK